MDSFKLEKSNKQGGLFKSFIIIYFAIVLVIVISLFLYYKKQTDNILQYLKISEEQSLRLEKSVILQKLDSAYSDILFLTNGNTICNYLDNKNPELKQKSINELVEYSKVKGLYEQIIFIDKNGEEEFIINYNNGRAYSVSKDKLTSLKNSYSFKDIFNLDYKQVYISPLELYLNDNLTPTSSAFKPIIMLGTPVFDSNGKKRGIIILNYLATDIITSLNDFAKLSVGRIMLVNSKGDCLFDVEAANKSTDFQYNYHGLKKFSNIYPLIWKEIIDFDFVQIITDKGLFSSTTIPLSKLFKVNTMQNDSKNDTTSIKNSLVQNEDEYFWKLITFIPQSTIKKSLEATQREYLFWLARILLIIATIPSFLVAYILDRRRYRQEELYKMANFDKLTNLPNRKYFFETLQKTVRQAVKQKNIFALLYIDIDNFKNINDTLGHAQGDILLQDAAKRFSYAVRCSDFVARIGGDEFVIILYNVKNVENAKMVANKVLENFFKPFLLEGEEYNIGISIGISVFSKESNNDSILLKQADDAMYKAKRSGKNNFKVFTAKSLQIQNNNAKK